MVIDNSINTNTNTNTNTNVNNKIIKNLKCTRCNGNHIDYYCMYYKN